MNERSHFRIYKCTWNAFKETRLSHNLLNTIIVQLRLANFLAKYLEHLQITSIDTICKSFKFNNVASGMYTNSVTLCITNKYTSDASPKI